MQDYKPMFELSPTEDQKLEAVALAIEIHKQELENAKKHIKELKEREAKLAANLKEKSDLLQIFCINFSSNKEEVIARLAKKTPKGQRVIISRILEIAYMEGYDTGSERNLRATLSELGIETGGE